MTIIQEYHKALDLLLLRRWVDFLESRHYITKGDYKRRCNICGKELRMRYEGSHFSQFKKIKPDEHEKVEMEFYDELAKALNNVLSKHGYRLLDKEEMPKDKQWIRLWVIRQARLYARTFNHYFKEVTIKLEDK